MPLQVCPGPAPAQSHRRLARRIAGAYFLFASAWVVLSDLVLSGSVPDSAGFAVASLIKGLAFVLVTTVLLYLFTSRHFRSFANAAARADTEQNLIEAEERYRALFERSLDCVFLADFHGNFLDANGAALALFGYRREELPSINFRTLVGDEQLPRALAAVARVVLTGTQPEPQVFTVRKRNGEQIVMESQSVLVYSDGKPSAILGIARDITERKRAEDALRESEQRFRMLVEQSISGFYLIQDGKFAYVNSRFVEIFGYGSPGEIIGRDPMEFTAAKDRAMVMENIRRRLAGKMKSISYSFTGLRKDGTDVEVGVHGSIATYQGHPVIMGLLQDISERKHAEEAINRYIARIEQAMHGTIGVVTAIGEARDPYTRGHERRVGDIAAAIATEMGLDSNRVEGIRIAGYMHDVGKIGVPAEILSKPGKLTKAEYELVKGHAEQGYEILKNAEFPWPIADTARQHHERLDGTGYPRGLRGDEIILEARVLAVADTLEAMSSHRPYRPGLGIDAALAELEKNRGRLYCPQAVDACLRLFREKGYTIPP